MKLDMRIPENLRQWFDNASVDELITGLEEIERNEQTINALMELDP
jgi:hypothetical protein